MTIRVGINGFGRMGRLTLRAAWGQPGLEFVHINDPAGDFKSFNAALCKACINDVKAVYLRIGKPRSLRAAGTIFFGAPYRMGTNLPIPPRTKPDAQIWITLEGWDGSMHQASVPLAKASPATVAWLEKQGGKK